MPRDHRSDRRQGLATATYDELGRQVTATKLGRYPEPAAYTARMSYDDAGNLRSVTSPTGEVTTHTYDALGQRVSTTGPAGVVTEFGYDIAGRQVRSSDGAGRTTYWSFDGAGRNTATYDLDATEHILRKVSATYDAAGNQTSITDATGHTTSYAYDALGRLTRQSEPVSDTESMVTTFGYDAAGNTTRFTDGRGNTTVQTYNTLGLPESVIEPPTEAHPALADRTWTVGYDLAENPVTESAPGGVLRHRTFDALGRLVSETGTGAEEPTAERTKRYDAAGRLLAVSVPGGEKTFDYNDRGAPLSTTGPVTGTTSYSYDAAGRLTSRTGVAGTSTFTYAQGRLATATDGLTGTTRSFGYNNAGELSTVGYGTSASRQYGYDVFGRLSSDTIRGSDGATQASMAYGYDLNDRLTSKTTTGTAGAGNNTYTYDHAGRLTSWTAGQNTTTYEWDASGNRTRAGQKTATFDARNRQRTNGADTLTWSPRGTLASRTGPDATTEFGFDAFDQMRRHGTTTYAYDGLGRMAARNGTGLGYDAATLNLVTDGTSTFARGADGTLLAHTTGGTNQLTVTDRHGDVTASLNPTTGALTSSTAYTPFGQATATTGTPPTLGFQSDYTDPTTVDMGARWYQPNTGTFTTRDTIALPTSPSGMANRYTYALSSPTNYTDPTGHIIGWLIGAALLHVALEVGAQLAHPGVAHAPTRRYHIYDWADPVNEAQNLMDWAAAHNRAAARGRSIAHGIDSTWQQQNGSRYGYRYTNLDGGGYVPPPPPPGIQARNDARWKAINNALPVPSEAKKLQYADGIVSSDPDEPASRVAELIRGVQDASTVYNKIKKTVLDPSESVVKSAKEVPVSTFSESGYRVLFGQKRAAPRFSKKPLVPNYLRGRTLKDVAEEIRAPDGRISAGDISITAFRYGDDLVSTNTRGLATLSLAGKRPTNVKIVPYDSVSPEIRRRLDEVTLLGDALPSTVIPVTLSQDSDKVLYTVRIP